MTLAIQCRGLVKRYGEIGALDGLELEVPQGSVFGFLGANGAGKSTTIRVLAGLARPTAGEVRVSGQEVDQAVLRGGVGYLDQQPRFYGWMTGQEMVELSGALYGLEGHELRQRASETLAEMGLGAVARRRVRGYSGGMKQRLGLALALVARPPVLLLDEPVSALDPLGRHEVLEIINGLRGKLTVFMSTHILADVERVCDHVAIIDKGRLVLQSTVADVRAKYARPVYVIELDPGREGEVEATVEALRREAWVSSVVREGDEVRVLVSDSARAGEELLAILAAARLPVRRFERGATSLEDIFLGLVGRPTEEESMVAAIP